jgi:hypothetical protein
VDAPAPARRGADPRAIGGGLLFVAGLALTGAASWKLFGGR